ncbi:uncharacterized protein LOC127856225 isoform X3 [Dreissena polymorpha]|uniref:uncharacterized protein LOC127856225 isoform X3 n=1 Tax=Dreissena polymorpha TaxID=45954 RepID=UPI002264D2D5|nr:uncharacterized protein LOC127856225 isoform X3 [Dreissena polymorpha]
MKRLSRTFGFGPKKGAEKVQKNKGDGKPNEDEIAIENGDVPSQGINVQSSEINTDNENIGAKVFDIGIDDKTFAQCTSMKGESNDSGSIKQVDVSKNDERNADQARPKYVVHDTVKYGPVNLKRDGSLKSGKNVDVSLGANPDTQHKDGNRNDDGIRENVYEVVKDTSADMDGKKDASGESANIVEVSNENIHKQRQTGGNSKQDKTETHNRNDDKNVQDINQGIGDFRTWPMKRKVLATSDRGSPNSLNMDSHDSKHYVQSVSSEEAMLRDIRDLTAGVSGSQGGDEFSEMGSSVTTLGSSAEELLKAMLRAPTQSITNGDRTDNSDEGSSIGRGGYSSARERSRDRESAVGRETDRDRERPGPSSALPDRHGYGPRSQQTPQDYSGGVISTQPRSQHGKKSIPRRHTVGGSGLLSQQEIQKETERSKEAFMDMLASRYPQYAEKISTTASEDGFPLRSGRSRDHHRRSTTLGYTQPGRPADYEGTMSEMDGPSFHRGGFVRSSLPATRSPPSVDKPPGLAFLIFRDETKKALLPNEITHLDTVRALFVRSFPGKLTMSFLESPKRKIYILEPRTNIYYQLEDLRDIRDRTVLRVHECDSMEPQRVNEKPEVRGRTVQVPASSVHGYYGAGPASAITSQVQKAQTLPAYMHQPIYMSHDDITQSPARTAYERSRSLTPDPVRTASYAQNPIYGRMGISPERPPPPSQDRIGPPDRQIGLRPIPENAQMLNGYGVKNGMGYDYTDISQGSHKQYVRQAMSPPAVSSAPRMDTGRRAFSPPPNLQNYDYIQVVPASQMGPTYMAKGVRASTMVTPQRATGAPPTSVTSTVSQVTTPTLPPSSQGQQQTSWRERSPVGRPPTALSTVPYSTSSSHHQQQQQQQQRSQSYRVPISNEREPVSSLRPRSMTPSPMDNYENDFTRNRIDKMEHQLANLAAWVQTAVIHSNTGAPSSVKGPSGPSSLTSEPSPLGAMPDSASGRVEGYEKEQPLYQGLSDLGSEGTVALSHDMKMNILSIKHQADALRLDLHSLRRLQQINKESIIETVDDAWKKIRDAMSSVPGAENIIIRQQRNEVDTMYQIYLEDKHLAEKELSDLEQAVEELRSDVLSRQCRVQMSDVEGMALILSHVTKQLGDLKARFPKLQERLKHVMAAEMEVIVREEKWLKDEPERLDNSLKKCKKLTGTLFTLKRLASVQEHRPPQTVSLSARARIPTLEDKKAVLENIQAMVPNHEARVQGIQAAENARMIKKKITTQQESLRFGKSLELATKALKPHGAPSSQPVGTTVSSCQLLSTATMGDTSSIISFVMPMSTSTPKSASQQATSKPESSATSPSIAYPVMSLIKTVSSGSEQMSARDFLYHDDPHAKVHERREQRLDGRSSKGLSSDPAVLPVTSTETTTHKRQIGRKGERAEKERAKQIDLTTQKTAARAAFFSSLSSPPTPTTSTSPITTGGSLSVDSPTEYGKGSSATGPQSKSVPSTVQTSKSAFSSSAVTQPHYGVSQISSLPSSALKPSSLPVSGSSIISSQRFSPASPFCYASTQTSSSQPRTTFTAIPKPYSPTKSRSSPLTPESPKYQIPPSQQGLVPQGRPHPFSLSGEDSQKESELSGARPKKYRHPHLPGKVVSCLDQLSLQSKRLPSMDLCQSRRQNTLMATYQSHQ